MTPIVYRIESIPAPVARAIRWNPLVSFFDCFHALLYDGRRPSTTDTALVVAWAAIALLVGILCYRSQADRLVERL
jgi:ABC-type polysaccharide/polyol phosphate export permease